MTFTRTVTIGELDYAEHVAPLRSAAAKDHVSLAQTRDTLWYGAWAGSSSGSDELVGVAGVIRIRGGRRIKGVYVHRALRGEGIGSTLTEWLIEQYRDELLEVLAYNPAFYRARGFHDAGSPRAGVTRLVRPGG